MWNSACVTMLLLTNSVVPLNGRPPMILSAVSSVIPGSLVSCSLEAELRFTFGADLWVELEWCAVVVDPVAGLAASSANATSGSASAASAATRMILDFMCDLHGGRA